MSTSDASGTEKERLTQEISQLDNEINVLKEQLASLEQQKKKLQKQIDRIDYQKNTEVALHLIEAITPQNSREIRLDYKTKTTPVMDSFYHSTDDYLILKSIYEAFGSSHNSSSKWFSLIIVKRKSVQGTIYVQKTGLTMTDLKKSLPNREFHSSDDELDERLSALYDEVRKIRQRDMTQFKKGQCIPFENICYLGAQTYQNQTGYGSEYYGNELVHEGTLYGETTGFLIIGVRIEN